MPDIEPWDIALNNRQREDIGLFMTYKRFDEMLERVRLDERQRIVTLLQGETYSTCNGDTEEYCLVCEINIHDAIDIINGEQNG